MILFIQYAVLTFESADEILLPFICYLFCRTFTLQFIYHVVLPFESVDEILSCYHSNESSSAVLSHGTVFLVSSNF